MLRLAKKHKIQITWFFGEADHGRGLIDSMAWFGCKAPIQHAIVANDNWYATAEEMCTFLKKCFIDDDSKYHFVVDPKTTAAIRENARKEHKIKGCRSSHVIVFTAGGDVFTRKVIDGSKEMMELKFDESNNSSYNDDDSDDEEQQEGPEDVTYIDIIHAPGIYAEIKEGSFVGIRAPAGSQDLFYVVEVIEKGIASEHMSNDLDNHCILKGQHYLIGCWLERGEVQPRKKGAIPQAKRDS